MDDLLKNETTMLEKIEDLIIDPANPRYRRHSLAALKLEGN